MDSKEIKTKLVELAHKCINDESFYVDEKKCYLPSFLFNSNHRVPRGENKGYSRSRSYIKKNIYHGQPNNNELVHNIGYICSKKIPVQLDKYISKYFMYHTDFYNEVLKQNNLQDVHEYVEIENGSQYLDFVFKEEPALSIHYKPIIESPEEEVVCTHITVYPWYKFWKKPITSSITFRKIIKNVTPAYEICQGSLKAVLTLEEAQVFFDAHTTFSQKVYKQAIEDRAKNDINILNSRLEAYNNKVA